MVFSKELKKSKVKVLVQMGKNAGRNDEENEAKMIGFDDLEISLLLADEMRKLVDKRVQVLVDIKKQNGR